MIDSLSSFVYGMCMMFYSMMAWMFWRKGKDVLSRLIMALMLVLDAECLKDLLFYGNYEVVASTGWYVMTSVDIIIIPLYAFVLMELVKPGWLTWKKAFLHEVPFVLLPILLVVTREILCYYVLVAWAAIYGSVTFVLTFFLITRYHNALKKRFSYQENINLQWLRAILVCFFAILAIWMESCFMTDTNFDNIYMASSLTIWVFISYFVYKHESVMDELSDLDEVENSQEDYVETELHADLTQVVHKLFVEEQLYLNPRLKLSDVARLAGTNRTYLSQFFNRNNGQTFYDYVNQLRVKHAENLLNTTNLPVVSVGEESGFNSLTTFRRVFVGCYGCSPAEYRKQQKNKRPSN